MTAKPIAAPVSVIVGDIEYEVFPGPELASNAAYVVIRALDTFMATAFWTGTELVDLVVDAGAGADYYMVARALPSLTAAILAA